MPAKLKRRGILCFFLGILLISIFPPAAQPRADKKNNIKLQKPNQEQPYPYQEFKTKTKKSIQVVGQAYRPQKKLVVLEMIPRLQKSMTEDAYNYRFGPPVQKRQENLEIQAVRIKTPDGKVYEGKIRRLPSDFMPTARKNYQLSENESRHSEYTPASKSKW